MGDIETTKQFDASSALRQGDILRWEQPDGSPWQQYAVVVTADCDLAHGKTSQISVVPLVRLDTYVRNFWGPEYVGKKALKVCEAAIAAINRRHSEANPEGAPLSARAIMDWLERDSAASIADALGLESGAVERKRFLKAMEAAQGAIKGQRRLENESQTSSYVKALTEEANVLVIGGKASPGMIKEALSGHCSSLPGDVFFVGEIEGESASGFFAMLRHISQCSPTNINLDPAARPGPQLPLRRIARMRVPFVYSMTQQLARIFADIGLPDDYPNRLAACVSSYLDEWTQ